MKQAANGRRLPFEKINDPELGEYHWMGQVGNETVIAVRPSRERGRLVMGPLGRLGSAAKGIRFQEATSARGIVQLGMAFGIDPRTQQPGDIVVQAVARYLDERFSVSNRRRLGLLES